MKRNKSSHQPRIRINEQIRADQVRVIQDGAGNLGVMALGDAITAAADQGMDLIEISPQADPPVAKIMDYGKYQYDLKKKQRDARAKAKASISEVKNIQVKLGTGDQDLMLKAKKASEWLREGHRIRVELYLRGRAKYMDKSFHRQRLDRVLSLLAEDYKVVEDLRKSPRGVALLVERDKSAKKDKSKQKADSVDTTSKES